MGKKQKEKQPPPPPPTSPSISSSSSSSSSSQDDEDSPPPAEKLPAGSTATRLPKPPEPSSDSTGSDEEEDESSEDEEGSKDEESSEGSGAAAVAKSNPLSLPQDSVNAIVKQTQNNAASSDLGSEDEEEGDEEEGSSSESDPSPPPPQSTGDAGRKKTATPIASLGEVSEDEDDESEDSSDSDQTAPPPPPSRSSSGNAADPSLKPLSSKPMDGPAQPAEKKPISGKRSAPSPSSASGKKRRTNDGVAVEGGQEKKETIFKRLWSMEDELALLQGVLDYKEQYHIVPSSLVQMDRLLESVKDSLSISVNRNQMNVKIRRLKLKYNNAAKRVRGDKNPKFSNPHDAAVFDVSKKIWGSSKEESQVPEYKIKLGKVKDNVKMGKGDQKQSAEEYHSMKKLTNSKAPNIASLLPFIDMSSAIGEELEGRCKKLDITFLQLQGKKQKIYPDVLKIIEDALRK